MQYFEIKLRKYCALVIVVYHLLHMIYSSQNISYSNLMMVLLDLVVIIKMYIYRGISIQKKNHIAAISLCK